MSDETTSDETTTQPAETFWEQHYRGQARVWSGQANPVLVDTVVPAGHRPERRVGHRHRQPDRAAA